MTGQDEGERFEAESTAEWGSWLGRNHARTEGVWLVTWKPGTGRPVLGYEDAVVEALRFGWIDSRPHPTADMRRTSHHR